MAPAPPDSKPVLTLLFDGGCPLCRREVEFLADRDQRRHGNQRRLAFVDVDSPEYDPALHGQISYRQAMGRIHALADDGSILRDVAVFRRAYDLIGLGWLYAPTTWPLLGGLVNRLYGLWARQRLAITGRPDLETLCRGRDACRREVAGPAGAGGASMGTADSSR